MKTYRKVDKIKYLVYLILQSLFFLRFKTLNKFVFSEMKWGHELLNLQSEQKQK